MSSGPFLSDVKFITADSSEDEKTLAKQQDEESSVRIAKRQALGEKVPIAKKRKLAKEERLAKKKAKSDAEFNRTKEITAKYVKFHRDLTEEEEKEAREVWEELKYNYIDDFPLPEIYILAVMSVLAKNERVDTDDEDEDEIKVIQCPTCNGYIAPHSFRGRTCVCELV